MKYITILSIIFLLLAAALQAQEITMPQCASWKDLVAAADANGYMKFGSLINEDGTVVILRGPEDSVIVYFGKVTPCIQFVGYINDWLGITPDGKRG